MHSPRSFNRRAFLKSTAASAIVAPFFVPNLISAPPSGRVLHASFGAGGMARADLSEFIKHPSVQFVAVADVEPNKANDLKQKFPELRVYEDWRQLLDKEKDLTSVNVSTPDHMHAPIAMSAMRRGLHVYGQKPLTHDIYETRKITEYARDKKLVTQMGIQIHSSSVYRQAVALLLDAAARGGQGAPQVYEKANTDARVILRAREPSWIRVSTPAGDYTFTRTLEPGEALLVPDRPDLELWTGNAPGLEILVDGTPVALPRGRVVRRNVSLNPDHLLRGQPR